MAVVTWCRDEKFVNQAEPEWPLDHTMLEECGVGRIRASLARKALERFAFDGAPEIRSKPLF